MGKLINLRHLEIDHTDKLKTLPKGISKLESLLTLTKFVTIQRNDKEDKSTCGLEDLKNLNSLKGYLKIEGLGYVTDANEVKGAELHKKSHLTDLHLDFGDPLVQNGNQDEVIEALEPHANLQSLEISSYGGTKLPQWIMKLTKLQKLFIKNCKNCSFLPPLGGLPTLMILHLDGLSNIKSLGLEFLKLDPNNNPNDVNSRNGKAKESDAAFPELKKLKISNMGSWEEWNVFEKDRYGNDLKIMPRLKCLKIEHCSNLREIPPLLLAKSPILKLRIDKCSALRQQYKKKTGEKWNRISHISKVRIS